MRSRVELPLRAMALGSLVLLMSLISANCQVDLAQQTGDKLDDAQNQAALELLEEIRKEGVDPIGLLQKQLGELRKNKMDNEAIDPPPHLNLDTEDFDYENEDNYDLLDERFEYEHPEFAKSESDMADSATSQAPVASNIDTVTTEASASEHAAEEKPPAPQAMTPVNEHIETNDTSKHNQESTHSPGVKTPSTSPTEQHIEIHSAAPEGSQQPQVMSMSHSSISPDEINDSTLSRSSSFSYPSGLPTASPPAGLTSTSIPQALSPDAPKLAPLPEMHQPKPEESDLNSAHLAQYEEQLDKDQHLYDVDSSLTESNLIYTPIEHQPQEPLLLAKARPPPMPDHGHLDSPIAQQTGHEHIPENHHQGEPHHDDIELTPQESDPHEEQHEETYIDNSDPHDPKQVHIKKAIKEVVGPEGSSKHYQESQTSTSLGNNQNSYHRSSTKFSSSSSSSSSSSKPMSPIGYRPRKKQRRHPLKKYRQQLQMPAFYPTVDSRHGAKSNKKAQFPPIPLVPLPLLPYGMPGWPHVYMDADSGPYAYQLPYGSADFKGKRGSKKRVAKHLGKIKNRGSQQAAVASATAIAR